MRNIRKKVKSLHIWKRKEVMSWYRLHKISEFVQSIYTYSDYSGNEQVR